MSFIYGVGDVVALGQFAWKIYKTCKDAPEGFKNVSQEVLSLHAVLKEVEEMHSSMSMSEAQQSRLRIVGDGCRGVLGDLQGILDRYNSLGTKTKRTWDRLGWGSKDIGELRSRLISNTGLLTAFVNTSQINVHRKLETFMQEFRDGKHEGSIVSSQTVDSLSTDERQTWRDIRKELEEIGISVAAFDANLDFIVNWFKTAISTGALEEQVAEDWSSDMSREEEDLGHDTVLNQPLADPERDTILTSTPVHLQASRLPSEANGQERRPPRVAGFINSLFRHNDNIFKAAQNEDETKMRQLLDKGMDINLKDHLGRTPLHHAVLSSSGAMVRLLLSNGADINAKDNIKCTALHSAAKCGNVAVVQLLLEYGAKTNQRNRNGKTALHRAVICGHEIVVQLLLNNGAGMYEKDGAGFAALHQAAVSGNQTVVQMLLENGAKVDDKHREGFTPLHLAASHGHEAAVQLLLKSGANINQRSARGNTALGIASFYGRFKVAEILRDAGGNV